jgi:hypothetical protein
MTPKNFINCKVHKLNLSGLMFIPIFFNNPNECKRTTLHSFLQHDSLENTINKSLVDLIIFCLKINIMFQSLASCNLQEQVLPLCDLSQCAFMFLLLFAYCPHQNPLSYFFVILHNVFSPTNVLRNHTSYELFHLNLRLRNIG